MSDLPLYRCSLLLDSSDFFDLYILSPPLSFLPPTEFDRFGYYARQIPPHMMDSNKANKDMIMLPAAPNDRDLILTYEMPLNTPPAGCCYSTASQPPSPPEIKRQKGYHRMISDDDEMMMASPKGDDHQLLSAKKLKEKLVLAKVKASTYYQDELPSVDPYGIATTSLPKPYQTAQVAKLENDGLSSVAAFTASMVPTRRLGFEIATPTRNDEMYMSDHGYNKKRRLQY